MGNGEIRSVADDAAQLDVMLYRGAAAGGFQAHAGLDPCELVSRLDDERAGCGASDAEELLVRVEAFYALMEYFFADGWEPVNVVRRVMCVTRAAFPHLLDGLSGRTVRLLCDGAGGDEMFRQLYGKLSGGKVGPWWVETERYSAGGRGRGAGEVAVRLENVMRKVWSSGGVDERGDGHVSLKGLLEVEGDSEWDGVRQAVFGELVRVFYEDGNGALPVVRRVYAIAKALRPSLICRMSLENMAWLCADGGRATQSARVKRVYNWLVGLWCTSGQVRASFQKSASASERYRAAQMGNQNRSKSSRGKMKGKRGK